MKKKIFSLLAISTLVLTACGDSGEIIEETDAEDIEVVERVVDPSDPHSFMEELSEYFEIDEEPEVHLDTLGERSNYYVDKFYIKLDKDRKMWDLETTLSKEETEELLTFFGLPQPENFDDLEPGEKTDVEGKYAWFRINRLDEEIIERVRKGAEERGEYYDERVEYRINVVFDKQTLYGE